MVSKIYTVGLMGIEGFIVDVEADVSNGLPSFDVIGLPDAAIKEAKERAKSAIKNSRFVFPAKHITINLAPAATRKEGSAYDLPIALSLLSGTGQINIKDNDKTVFMGEVSLDGTVNAVRGILPMVIFAYKNGFNKAFVPAENADEAAVIDGMEIYPVKSLKDIVNHFSGEKPILSHNVSIDEIFAGMSTQGVDFADVKGQENVKRALEIAAAGNHNIIMLGDLLQPEKSE